MESIDNRLLLAMPGPMEGVMTPAFFQAFTALELGSCFVTPFLRISESVLPDRRVHAFLAPFLDKRIVTIAQIMGTDPVKLATTSRQLIAMGAAGINLNFGCPSRKVVQHGAGGGNLRDLGRLLDILDAVKSAVPETSVSAKIRLGFEHFDEMNQLLPALNRSGTLDFLVIHCRLVKELYLPIPDRLERFQKAVSLTPSLRVVLNGDIATSEQALTLLGQTSAVGVMAARPFLKDPLLLRRIQQLPNLPPPETIRQQFYQAVLNYAVPPYHTGKKIELSNLIFSPDNPYLPQLLAEARKISS